MNEMMKQETETKAKAYAPTLTFFHANGKGTGGAVSFERIPATQDREGCLMAVLANQKTVGNRTAPTPVYPRFDWENRLIVKLNFSDLCQMIQVFRGECETVNGEKGLVHQSGEMSTRILLRHVVDPVAGYSFEVYRDRKNGEESRARVFLYPNEALGLCKVIEDSLAVICFGLPTEVNHGVAA